MLDVLVGQFLKSSDGSGLLKDLQAKGLTEAQATQAVTATAEGAVAQNAAPAAPAGSGIAGLLDMLGGSVAAPASAGGLLGMLGAASGPVPTAPAAAPPAHPIALLVAQKTGLPPAMAQMVVAAALPRLLSLLGGAAAGQTR
jgi:hypothetical protein